MCVLKIMHLLASMQTLQAYIIFLTLPLIRLIYDPMTGKSRGFGFCEYEDSETAMSAVRNLSGRELNGRPLRIDSATNAPGGGGGGGGGGDAGRAAAGRPVSNLEVGVFLFFFFQERA